jgi:hypothetical protein
MMKNKIIKVQGREIALISDNMDDFISLTDMARTGMPKEVIIFFKTG